LQIVLPPLRSDCRPIFDLAEGQMEFSLSLMTSTHVSNLIRFSDLVLGLTYVIIDFNLFSSL